MADRLKFEHSAHQNTLTMNRQNDKAGYFFLLFLVLKEKERSTSFKMPVPLKDVAK